MKQTKHGPNQTEGEEMTKQELAAAYKNGYRAATVGGQPLNIEPDGTLVTPIQGWTFLPADNAVVTTFSRLPAEPR